jgi:hypothetical protein
VPQTRDRWDPPPPAIPGPETTRLRQTAPTVCAAPPDPIALPRAYVPHYAWDAFDQAASPEAWMADDSDLPELPVDIATDPPRG